jgi:hypothetical protein
MRTNHSVYMVVNTAVYWAVPTAMGKTVNRAVPTAMSEAAYWAAFRAVVPAVDRGVSWAVSDAVNENSISNSTHPALAEFMSRAGKGAS